MRSPTTRTATALIVLSSASRAFSSSLRTALQTPQFSSTKTAAFFAPHASYYSPQKRKNYRVVRTLVLLLHKRSSSSIHSNMSLSTASSSSPKRKAHTALDESGVKGEFKRTDARWRNWIGRDNPQFPAEPNRYHLYVAYACPWAHRTLMARALKGLQHVISVTIVHPTWQRTRPNDADDTHTGWFFADNDNTTKPQPGLVTMQENGGTIAPWFPGNTRDPILGAQSMRDIYEKVGDTAGKYSVPVLFDTKTKTIVSNESADIVRMLNSEFNAFAKHPDLDLYPKPLRTVIDETNDWVYTTINNGVYRCGFAKSQEAYDEAIAALTASFDRVDAIFQKQRFLTGDTFTEADLRLFVTLLRFDEVYIVYFKTNTRSVAHTPAILRYCRDIYHMDGVKDTVNMEQIKTHYFTSHRTLNHYSIIPRGPDFIALLEQQEKPE